MTVTWYDIVDMGEVIRAQFGAAAEGPESTSTDVLDTLSLEDVGQEDSLWGQLSFETQDMLKRILKSIIASKKAGHLNWNPDMLSQQRAVVRQWTDEQTAGFVANTSNWEALKSHPYLVTALFERLTGKL